MHFQIRHFLETFQQGFRRGTEPWNRAGIIPGWLTIVRDKKRDFHLPLPPLMNMRQTLPMWYPELNEKNFTPAAGLKCLFLSGPID